MFPVPELNICFFTNGYSSYFENSPFFQISLTRTDVIPKKFCKFHSLSTMNTCQHSKGGELSNQLKNVIFTTELHYLVWCL